MTREGIEPSALYNIVTYDADGREHARDGRYYGRNLREAESHAARQRETIQRNGWNMTVRIERETRRANDRAHCFGPPEAGDHATDARWFHASGCPLKRA